jgi:hypothetical protein
MLADKIWLMANGKMYEGTPSQLMQANAFDEMLAGTKLKMENGEIKIIVP